MLKKIAVGLTLALAATLPQTAGATTIEAVWDIELQMQRPTGTSAWGPVTIPTTYRMTTTFENYVSRVYDYGTEYSTYFGTSAENDFDHVVADHFVENPFGPATASEYVNLETWFLIDDLWSPTLNISFDQSAIQETGDDAYHWLTWETITVSPNQLYLNSGEPTPDDLWDLLSAFQTSPELFYGGFFAGSGVIRESDRQYLSGTAWSGTVRLASLRRIDVPEPPAMALIGAGLLSVVVLRRRRQVEKADC